MLLLLITTGAASFAQEADTPYNYVTTLELINSQDAGSLAKPNVQEFEAIKLYNKTYTVKGLAEFDEKIIKKINLNKYKHLYKPEERVEVLDFATNRYLILFAESEISISREVWKRSGAMLIGTSGFDKAGKEDKP